MTDPSLSPTATDHSNASNAPQPTAVKRIHLCDRCGTPMKEKQCKISCPNCGNRFDCSDLNIYFD